MKTNTYELMRKEREKSIIQVAQKVFFSKGIANTTMKDIASEADISRQTLYSYYKDINELIIAVQSDIFKNCIFKNSPEYDDFDNMSPVEYIQEYVISILSLADEYPKETIFMIQYDLYFKLYPSDDLLFKGFNSLFIKSDTREKVFKKIVQGQQDSSIRKDKSSSEIYSTIVNITIGLVHRILLVDDRIDITNEITSDCIKKNLIEMIMLYIRG